MQALQEEVRRSPALLKRLKFSGGIGREYNIAQLKTGSFFRPISKDAGKTGSDSAAGGCLAFFTGVEVEGRPRTAVGVVMGQGEGSDTASLLAAAGEAAERLVDNATAKESR